MSNQYSFSLMTKQRQDVEKMLARAEEVLKELDPDGNSGVKFVLIDDDTSFGIGDGNLMPIQADLASKVIDAVVATFPEMSLRYYETCNGPLSREAVSKEGKLVDIDPWHVVVIMQNEDDYKSVVDYLKEKTAFEITQCTGATHRPQDPYSVRWQFDGNTENDLTTACLNDLGRHFPEMLFQCYKYSDCLEAEGREIQNYAAFHGHEVNWEEPNPGLRALMQYSDYIDENITYGEVLFKTEQVLQAALAKVRTGVSMCMFAVEDYLFYQQSLQFLQTEDFGWLKNMADDDRIPACCLLLLGMDRKTCTWEEIFTDEDTGEEVKILREGVIDGTLFEPDETLKQQLAQKINEIAMKRAAHPSYDDLEEFRMACRYPFDATPLQMVLIQNGEENEALYIEDPAILQGLCDKGNKWAAYKLCQKFLWGDEERGIFINKVKAKDYFDLAGDVTKEYEEEWDDVDDPGDEDPEEFLYTLTGNAEVLNGVETLIEDLCHRFGTPGNECGLYMPQQMLMKVLVGSDSIYYRGNIMTIERVSPDCLVITTEADNGEPLLYALRYSFDNLAVEISSNRD